jgi:hypothetical protein
LTVWHCDGGVVSHDWWCALWYLYIPPALTIVNAIICPPCELMFLWFPQWRVLLA